MAESFNHFDKIADSLEPTFSKIVRKTAFDIQAKAAQKAPVDTGFLRNSIYVLGSGFNTYGRGVQRAGKLKPDKHGTISRRRLQAHVRRLDRQRAQEAMLLPEMAPPPDKLTAYVAVGASYGIFLEFGTSRHPAKPYFYSAVDAVLPGLEAALAAVADKLAEATT